MTAKKDRSRFTVRFNLNDPAHRQAVACLERQGARNKANYLANAVLCYEAAAPQSAGRTPQGISRADIEAVVLEVLARRQSQATLDLTDIPDTHQNAAPSDHQKVTSQQDDALGLISDALAAFQGG